MRKQQPIKRRRVDPQCCPECGGNCPESTCWQRSRGRADRHEGHRGDE